MTNTIVKNVQGGSTNQITNQTMMEKATAPEFRRSARIAEAVSLLRVAQWTTRWERKEILVKASNRIDSIRKREYKKLRGIIKTLSDVSGYKCEEIYGKSRKMKLVSVRQLYCYLAEKTLAPLEEIGFACNMDHSTVIHSNNVITNILCNNHWDNKSIYVKEILDKYDKAVSGNLN